MVLLIPGEEGEMERNSGSLDVQARVTLAKPLSECLLLTCVPQVPSPRVSFS